MADMTVRTLNLRKLEWAGNVVRIREKKTPFRVFDGATI